MLAVCDDVTNWTVRVYGVLVRESEGSGWLGKMILK